MAVEGTQGDTLAVEDTQAAMAVVGTQEDTLVVVGTQGDTLAVEDTQDTMAVVGTQAGTMAMVDTRGDIMAMVGTEEVITTVTVRDIIPVGTVGMGIILVVIGGALGAMLIQVGGGLIRMSIHIPITILILILIPVPIFIPPMMCLRRRSPQDFPPIASSRNNLTTGTTARIRRVTIHMLKAVREAGHRWNQDQLRPNREGGHSPCTGDGVFYSFLLS